MGGKPKNKNTASVQSPPPTVQSVLATLNKIAELIKPKKNGARTKPDEELNNETLTKSLEFLKTAVEDMAKYLLEDEKSKVKLENKARISEDEADAQNQKNLRGTFIITSSGDLVKTDDELKAGNISHVAHAKELAFDKYGVDIPDSEIASCYSLKKGGMVLSLWNLSQGSAFQNLVRIIKKNEGKKDVNLYFNFMLTRRRSTLLYEIRKLKRTGMITKFFSDENGSISVQKDKEEKKKITNRFEENAEGMKTLYIEEIVELFQ